MDGRDRESSESLPADAPAAAEAVAAASWRAATASCRGAAHYTTGRPNQDAVKVQTATSPGTGPVTALAVADGHGDGRHFRSGTGSQLAVAAGCGAALAAAREVGAQDCAEAVLAGAVATVLPTALQQWLAAVEADVAAHPFTPEELSGMVRVDDNTLIPYGTTLLVALVTPRWAVLAQIGDGDIVMAGPSGDVRVPVPGDPALDGCATTSLCQADALDSFRVAAVDLVAVPTAALMLVTDGYSNAQEDDAWYGPVGSDLVSLIGSRGSDWVLAQLPAWAEVCASRQGSGDDATLGLLFDPSQFPARMGSCGPRLGLFGEARTLPATTEGIARRGPSRAAILRG